MLLVMHRKPVLTFAFFAFVGAVVFLAAYMAAAALPVQDLSQYWSAARLVRQNPYSYPLVAELERSCGLLVDPTMVLKNPPWSIPFILPLGFFNYRGAFALWSLFSIVAVTWSSHAIWKELKLPESQAPLLLTLFFGPVIVLLMLGQWTTLVLLGLSIFLIAVERRHDWLAGASLLLVLGKPHVALLFLVVLALWILQTRRWAIAISGFLAMLVASLFVMALNPHIFTQFWERTFLVLHETEAYPNLGGMLFLLTGARRLALIPQVAGLIWMAFYWRAHRKNWSWWKHGTVVILCSVVCSFYSFPYDEILALPALLIAYANGNRRLFFVVFTITDLGYFLYIFRVAAHFGYGYMFLWWTATGWLIAYAAAQRPKLGLVPASEANP
jgi:hypothetical protein